MKTNATVDVNGTPVAVSNLEKVMYPEAGFTKGDVIDYYVKISPVLLPHLHARPLTLKRYPDGVNGIYFYERHCPSHRPKWVRTAAVSRAEGGKICYCVLDGLPALVWAANLADLELHTFLHQAPAVRRPRSVVFDLDPGPPADNLLCCEVGLALKRLLSRLGLKCFPKTSGSKGMQVYIPLNSHATYERTKAFAHAVAEMLERKHPDQVVSKMQKSLRPGKVLVDWSQNDDHKTTVSVYSLRAKEQPTVSTPIKWSEVTSALKHRDAPSLTFTSAEVLKRVEKMGDLFKPVLTLRQTLPALV